MFTMELKFRAKTRCEVNDLAEQQEAGLSLSLFLGCARIFTMTIAVDEGTGTRRRTTMERKS